MTLNSIPDESTHKGCYERTHKGYGYQDRRSGVWMRLPNQFVLLIITGYRRIVSPVLPRVCRFTPSCSEYGFQAFQTYPFFKALWLTVSRISRCHPFHKGGYDPLP